MHFFGKNDCQTTKKKIKNPTYSFSLSVDSIYFQKSQTAVKITKGQRDGDEEYHTIKTHTIFEEKPKTLHTKKCISTQKEKTTPLRPPLDTTTGAKQWPTFRISLCVTIGDH